MQSLLRRDRSAAVDDSFLHHTRDGADKQAPILLLTLAEQRTLAPGKNSHERQHKPNSAGICGYHTGHKHRHGHKKAMRVCMRHRKT